MDGKLFKPGSNFMPNKCATRLHGEVDRISGLPTEIIVVILSFLSLRDAASTSVVSSRWLDLWKYTPNMKSDRISQLPDQIIIAILSFLPLKKAAATSVLSSRWLDLWKHTASLDFSTSTLKSDHPPLRRRGNEGIWDVERCKYIELVNSVLHLHKGHSLKQFCINFFVNKSGQLEVAQWLDFVFLRGVETLALDFESRQSWHMVVVDELLRLCSPQTLILFKSLKSLCLRCFTVSGEAIELFLRNSPLLEELIISCSFLTSNLELCGAIKKLEVYDCWGGKSIKVSAPNLTSLRFGNTLGKLFLENVPEALVEADFAFLSPSLNVLQNVASALFCFSSQLKILILTLQYPKVFLENGFPRMPYLRKLVVEYHGGKTDSVLPVTALIWACPRLLIFKIMYKKSFVGDTDIQVVRNSKRCRHKHLRLFVLGGFARGPVADDLLGLVTYVSDNCVRLGKVIVGVVEYQDRFRMHPNIFAPPNERQFSWNYAKQQLQGKLPPQTKLQITYLIPNSIH